MTDKEKTLAEKYLQLKEKQKKMGEKADCVLEMLKKEAPHKVGEIIRWVTPKYQKNIGSRWYPNYVEVPEKVNEAVLYNICVTVSNYENIRVTYSYEFHPLKKDGGINQNPIYPRNDYDWTGKMYKPKK